MVTLRFPMAFLLGIILAAPSAAADVPETTITLLMRDEIIEPQGFTVESGALVHLVLINDADRSLDFALDAHDVQVDPLPAGAQERLNFTAREPGKYYYWSSTHAHADMGAMEVTESTHEHAGEASGTGSQDAPNASLGIQIAALVAGIVLARRGSA